MDTCKDCANFLVKTIYGSKINLERSFTKIDNKLHLGFNRPIVCTTIANYNPDTIIFAGNGAVELYDGGDCWEILKNELTKRRIIRRLWVSRWTGSFNMACCSK